MSPVQRIIARFRERFPTGKEETWAWMAGVIESEYQGETQLIETPKITKGARDSLIQAIITECGGDPFKATKTALRAAAVAVNEILKVYPSLTTADITNAVRAYQKLYDNAALTPHAICKNWDKLEKKATAPTSIALTDIYIEPDGWRWVMCDLYGIQSTAIHDKQWLDIGPDLRRGVLAKLRERRKQIA